MHYKLKCFESRGEMLCDSSPVPPSERNPVNTIYFILHIPSPPCAVCVNVLIPSPAPCNRELNAAAPISQPAGHPTHPSGGMKGTPGRGWRRAWMLVKDKAPSHPEHPDALPASPQVGFTYGRGGNGGGRASSGYWAGGAEAALCRARAAPPGSLGAQRDV